MVITTAQLYSTKSELRVCVGSNSVRGVWLEIKLNAFRRSTIPLKQFIIITITQMGIHDIQRRESPQVIYKDLVSWVARIQESDLRNYVSFNFQFLLDYFLMKIIQ